MRISYASRFVLVEHLKALAFTALHLMPAFHLFPIQRIKLSINHIPDCVNQNLRHVRHARTGGFTLVEMMIVLLIFAVVLSLAAPGFSDLIKNNRMLTQVYEMRALLNNARSEALSQREFVTFCSSADGETCGGVWQDGYIAFVDLNGNGVVDNPDDPAGDIVFQSKVRDSNAEKFVYSNAENRIRFDNQGYSIGFNGTFTICDDRGETEARGLIVTSSGIVRSAELRDDDGVLLDDQGDALDCS